MDYAIAVGINEYKDNNLRTLRYAEKDAKMFFEIMKSQFEIEHKNNFLLLGLEATKDNLKQKIENINAKQGDRVFFFFAGHGQSLYDDPNVSCYDSEKDVNEAPNTWLNVKSILGLLVKNNANILCFLDSCESTAHFSPIPRGGEKTSVIDGENYICVFSAANYNECTYDDDDFQHGRWSYFLFQALKGDPDALIECKLTNNSLQNYLKNKFEEQNVEKGTKQTPFVWGKLSGEFIIKDFSFKKTNESIFVNNIYFGAIDADSELRERPNGFLKNYFDLRNVTEEIINKDNVQFVLGRKGTGKTYIGKYMEMMFKRSVKYYSIEGFDYKGFILLSSKGVGYEPYVTPWKYYFLVNILSGIASATGNQIFGILEDLYGKKVTTHQVLNRKFKKGIRFKSIELSEKFKRDLSKDDDIFSIEEIVQIFLYIIEDLKDLQYIFIVDGLDEKINENNQYKNIMNALIWAIKELNDYMYKIHKKIKCVAFFRKDIFELVHGANIAKLANGSTVNLEWVDTMRDKKKYPLYQFINLRYINFLQENNIDSGGHDLTEIFPAEIRQGNKKIDTWNWILDFTTYKPRDVVEFLRECVKKCNPTDTSISESAMWEAQFAYSKYLIEELENELYGFLDGDLIQRLFREFQSMGTKWNSYEELQRIINRCSNRKGDILSHADVMYIIEKLYEVGVIGIQLPNGKEQWIYRRNMMIKEYIDRSKFKLHRGLWKGLSIW